MNDVLIEDCFERIKNGYSIPNSKDKKGIPITRIETISNGEIDFNKVGFADIFEIKGIEEYLVKKDDILMSHINSVSHLGKTAIFENEESKLIHGMNLLLLRTNDKLSPRYAFYFFHSNRFKSSLSSIIKKAVNQASFSTSSFKKLQIPLPSLPIQQKIAAVLDKADAIRKRSQQILGKYDQLAQSVFLEMFGKNQYEVLLGKSLLKIQGGAAFKSTDYQTTGIPVVRIGTVNKGYFDESQIVFLPENQLKSYSKYILKPGDLLLTLTGTVGKEDYGNLFVLGNQYPEYFLNQRVAKLELNEKKLRVHYFKFFLEQPHIKSKLIGVSRGVRQANISNGDIYNLEINVPPIELQNKFASIIAQIEKQKAQTQAELEKAEMLYQSLLLRAFSGNLFPEN